MEPNLDSAITDQVEEVVDGILDDDPLTEIWQVGWDDGVVYLYAKRDNRPLYVYSLGGSESSHAFTDMGDVPAAHRSWFTENAAVH